MATLWINDKYQKDFNKKVDAYVSKLNDIKAQYRGTSTYTSPYRDSNISDCNVYLKKRLKELDARTDKAITLKTRANNYVTGVVSTDNSLASSIHKQSYSLYAQKGIGPKKDSGLSRFGYGLKTRAEDFIDGVVDIITGVGDFLKDFYDEFKYVINVIVDIGALIGAFALFAISGPGFLVVICAIGAYWAIAESSYELITDIIAVGAWLKGDIEQAEEFSNKKLQNTLMDGAAWLDQLYGGHIAEIVCKIGLFGLETCRFVASMAVIYNEFRSCFNLNKQLGKDKNLNCTDLGNKSGRKWGLSKADWKKTKFFHKTRMGSGQNWLKWGLKSAGFKIKLTSSTTKETMKSFAENWDKNKTVLDVYRKKGPYAFIEQNPVSKQIKYFGNEIRSIISY